MGEMSNGFKLNTFELRRRAGEMKEYELDITLTENMGVDLISVPIGENIEIDARLESVTEGILLTATVYAIAKGECIRCLDPIEIVVDRNIQELFGYESTSKTNKTQPVDDMASEDQLMMEGDLMDLEPPVRDAIILSLPVNPVCNQECQGLCPECGVKWLDLDSDHAHQLEDKRWASLNQLNLGDPDFKI